MSVISKLKKQENFTFVESTLANYIINHIDTAYKMSLKELADVSHVSKPSVIRLYRKVGCQSYREFSIALQLEKTRMNSLIEADENHYLLDTADMYDFSLRLASICKQTVETMIESRSPEHFEEIITMLDQAKRIYFISDVFTAEDVRSYVNHQRSIGYEVVFIDTKKEPLSVYDEISKDDVMVICTETQINSSSQIYKKIASRKARKLLITNIEQDPEVVNADLVFNTYPDNRTSVTNGAFMPHLSVVLGLNVLESCLYKKCVENQYKQ